MPDRVRLFRRIPGDRVVGPVRNAGTQGSPMLSEILPLDMLFPADRAEEC